MPKSSQYGSKFSYSKKNRAFIFSAVLIFVGLFFFSGNIKTTQAADSYTKLLLHGDGTNGSTTFTDSSPSQKTVTTNGNAQISTAQSEFGGNSMSFDGTGDYLTIPASTDFNLGTGDFTIDTWFRWNGIKDSAVLDFGGTGSNRFTIDPVTASRIYITVAGSGIDIASGVSFSNATWYHVAVVRNAGVVKVYINGVEKGSASIAGQVGDSTSNVYVGRFSGYTTFDWLGYIDELRISKGIARWTSNFTPPTRAYDDTSACGYQIDDAQGNEYSTVQVGTQCWTGQNMRIGSMIAGTSDQTDNSTIEKYCYANTASNCDSTGGLYQWDEAMQYSGTEGAQGICPTGFHVPTDGEFNTMEQYLTDNGQSCDTTRNGAWGCSAAGTKLKAGGSSGFNLAMTGNRSITGSYANSAYGLLWSSTLLSGSYPWVHFVGSGNASVAREADSSNPKAIGFTIRCLANPTASYTLTYTAGNNGTISGTTPQTVTQGLSGTAITAVPSTGYHFVNWSDSSTSNPRTDTNIQANISVTANFAINTYTLTYTAGSNGSISGTTPQTVNYNASGSAVTAVPNTGYHFVNWSDSSATNPRTDTGITSNLNLTANFAINSYALTYAAGVNGSLTGTTSQNVNFGSNGTAVTAVPAANYHFVQWNDGVTANPRTDTNISANVNVTASFAIDTKTLTYTAGSNGTLTGSTSQSVAPNGNGTAVTAVPNAGCYFINWSDSSTSNPRTDMNVTNNITVTANFGINTYTLTYTAGSHGSISGTTPQTVDYGSSGSAITVVPDTNYAFAGWSDGSKQNPRTDVNVQSNSSVTANFVLDTYTKLLLHSDGTNGSTTFNDYSLTPKTVTANSGAQVSTAQSKFGGASAYFGGTGYLNVTNSSDFDFGTGDFTVDWWEFRTATTLGGLDTCAIARDYAPTDQRPQPAFSFGCYDSADNTLSASFSNDGTNTGTLINGTMGTVSLNQWVHFAVARSGNSFYIFKNGTQTATFQSSINLYVDIDNLPLSIGKYRAHYFQGYMDEIRITKGLARWTANFTPPASAYDLSSNYTLTYAAGANGSISGTTLQTVASGQSGSAVTAVPSTGYHFVNWSDSSTSNPRTDANISGNVTVTANFAINSYTLTYTAGSNGSLSGTNPLTVNYGSNGSQVSAVPNTGYHFTNWSDSSNQNPRTDTNITSNLNLTANFAIDTYTITFNKNGGDTEANPTTRTTNYNTTVALPTAPTKANYNFTGWNTAANGSGTTFTVSSAVTNDLTVYAQWATNSYTVTFNKNGGDTEANPTTRTANYNSTITSPTAPTKTGSAFNVWNTVADGSGTTFTNATPVIGNLTVYAQWTINAYTLSYSANANGSISGTTSQTVSYNASGSSVTAVPNANFRFTQWNDGNTNPTRTDTNITSNKSFTASFALNDQVIDNPTPQKITDVYNLGAFTLTDGTSTSTSKATTTTNLTLTSNNTTLEIPSNTQITKTDSGNLNLTNLTTSNITQSIQATVGTSKAAVKIGIPNIPITFSQDVTINLSVPSSYNNETLTIYTRQDNATDWTKETTCLVTNSICSFTTRHATEFTANFEVSNSPDPTHVNMDINSTITIDCKDKNTNTNDYIAMNPITGTGKSTPNANNDVNCNVITNNSNGYSLSFTSSTPELKNSNNDTIHSYTPQTTSTPETWSVSTADSEWGARLVSNSSTYDPTTWGTAGTDDYSAKWYAVTSQNNFILANRGTETAQTGDDQIIRFGAEIGSSKFQPTGTYTDNVTFTAVTN